MLNLDNVTTKNDNKGWPYRILIIGPSGSRKTNTLFNPNQEHNNIIDKIYLYAKDLEEPKYQLLIKKRENVGIKNLNAQVVLLNTGIVWMIFTIILMITIQKEKEKF